MALNLNVKDHITGVCTFEYYRGGCLWYRSEGDLLFPVPVEDVGDAQFRYEERAMLMMRYIRKHLLALEKELQS